MKKLLLLLFFAPLVILSSCSKDKPFDPAGQAAIDQTNIQSYLAANPSIVAQKDTSGIYYQILAPGTGTHPAPNATVTIDYTTTLLNGLQVDYNTQATTNIQALLPGWQLMLPQIAAGGTILLIMPSTWGYGPYTYGRVPPNSVLVCKLTLDAVQNNN